MDIIFFFSATVGNLQSKVEGLTTTNALMKEDLAIARNSLLTLQAENLALRRSAQQATGSGNNGANVHPNNVLDHIDPEMAEALSAERKKRHDVERELELQVNESTFDFLYGRSWFKSNILYFIIIFVLDVFKS